MMRALTLIFFLLMSIIHSGQSQVTNPDAVPTFECIGIYFHVDSENLGEGRIIFRTSDTDQWQQAMPLWFDQRNREYRGCIVGLKADTEYIIHIIARENKHEIKCKTLDEHFRTKKLRIWIMGSLRRHYMLTSQAARRPTI